MLLPEEVDEGQAQRWQRNIWQAREGKKLLHNFGDSDCFNICCRCMSMREYDCPHWRERERERSRMNSERYIWRLRRRYSSSSTRAGEVSGNTTRFLLAAYEKYVHYTNNTPARTSFFVS
jgi:hypothetical protein